MRAQVFEKFESFHLAQVGRKISETVDLDRSAEESRTVILTGLDEELDQMKRTLDGLDSLLNEVATKLSEKMPSDVRASLNVIYFPQIGFLVTVPMNPATGNAVYGGSFDNPWERMFVTEYDLTHSYEMCVVLTVHIEIRPTSRVVKHGKWMTTLETFTA